MALIENVGSNDIEMFFVMSELKLKRKRIKKVNSVKMPTIRRVKHRSKKWSVLVFMYIVFSHSRYTIN